jgi:hypothetical protein
MPSIIFRERRTQLRAQRAENGGSIDTDSALSPTSPSDPSGADRDSDEDERIRTGLRRFAFSRSNFARAYFRRSSSNGSSFGLGGSSGSLGNEEDEEEDEDEDAADSSSSSSVSEGGIYFSGNVRNDLEPDAEGKAAHMFNKVGWWFHFFFSLAQPPTLLHPPLTLSFFEPFVGADATCSFQALQASCDSGLWWHPTLDWWSHIIFRSFVVLRNFWEKTFFRNIAASDDYAARFIQKKWQRFQVSIF